MLKRREVLILSLIGTLLLLGCIIEARNYSYPQETVVIEFQE